MRELATFRKAPRWLMGIAIVSGLSLVVVGMLAFAHAFAHVGGEARCFSSFRAAQWPKWIGCAMAAHENLAGGLIGLAGAIFAAWLAYSGAQDQLAQANSTVRETNRLRAQEKFRDAAGEMDSLRLAASYLSNFASRFPEDGAGGDFVAILATLHEKAHVYLSQSAANAPMGFGRSITTVMWRLEKLADKITELSDRGLLLDRRRKDLEAEIRASVAGARKLADEIHKLMPSLEERLVNLRAQYQNFGGD